MYYTPPTASPVQMLPEGIKIIKLRTYLTFLTSCTVILINISLCIVSSLHFNFPKCIELFHPIIWINEFKIMLVNALLHFNLLIWQCYEWHIALLWQQLQNTTALWIKLHLMCHYTWHLQKYQHRNKLHFKIYQNRK